MKKLGKGNSTGPEKQDYVDRITDFIEMLAAEKSASKNTLFAYSKDIQDLAISLEVKKIPLNKVITKNLREYVIFLQEKKQLSASSLARKISAIRHFFSFLHNDSIIGNNPSSELEIPRKKKGLPKAVSEKNVESLLEAAYENCDNTEGFRNIAMLEILYATGIRISELVTLKMNSMLHIKSMKILINGKGNKERMVLLGEKAISALNRYMPYREEFIKKSKSKRVEWLFPSLDQIGNITHITRQRFGQILKKFAVMSGIPSKFVSPHKIRHSFATHMLKNGANLRVIQTLLGHSSINSTQIYTKVENEDLKGAIFDTHPLRKGLE